MWVNEIINVLRRGSLVLGMFASVCQGMVDGPVQSPGVLKVSAAQQSAWLDQSIPKLLGAMRTSKEVRARIAGPLGAEPSSPFSLTPRADGLGPGDLDRWSSLVDEAIAANPRYGQVKVKARPTVAVMPHTGIVRVESTYPAPPASRLLEPGPLTIDAWICPDRETALALFWLRKGGFRSLSLNERSPETVMRSVLDLTADAFTIDMGEHHPGEAATWDYPREMISVLLTKSSKSVPPDRLVFLRSNVVVEASTVEYRRKPDEYKWNDPKTWFAFRLDQCAPDVIAILRAIDAGLMKFKSR